MRSRAVIVAAVFAAALVSGGWLMQAGYDGTRSVSLTRARLFDEVLAHVENFYVDTVPEADLYRKAVDGMLLELHDPHSVFLPPDRLAKLNESTTGRYAGVGIQMDVRDGWITVVSPLPNTPAQRAGILTGDRVVEIDGRSTRACGPTARKEFCPARSRLTKPTTRRARSCGKRRRSLGRVPSPGPFRMIS